MRNSTNHQSAIHAPLQPSAQGFKTVTRSRRRWIAAALAGVIFSGGVAPSSIAQQPAVRPSTPKAFAPSLTTQGAGVQSFSPAISSVLTDTAMAGNDSMSSSSLSRGIYQPQATRINLADYSPSPVITVAATNPVVYPAGKEPEGKLLSSKIISSSEPVVVAQQPMGGDGVPSGHLTGITGMPVDGSGYGFEEATSFVPAHGHHGSARPSRAVMGGYSTIRGSNNSCCPEDCRRYYGGYEAFYMQREGDETFSLSRGNFLTNYGYEFGHRITIGQMLDCTDGVELVYTGPFQWDRTGINLSTAGQLQSVLTTGLGYVDAQIDTFNDSVRHLQGHRAELQSFEANRRWFAWDIMSTIIGIRAIQYDENFSFDSVALDSGAGFFRTGQTNFLIGGQIGSDIMRPISQRLSIGSRSRLGAFANFNEGNLFVANRGVTLINAKRSDTDISGLVQIGAIARYRILPNLIATAGYESMALAGIATVSDQRYLPLNPGSGGSYRANDFIFFHGGTFGLELSY